MKNWMPQDFLAFGLLMFIFAFLISVAWLRSLGELPSDSIGNKEIVIYIVGVLSGYIGTKKFNKKEE